MRGYRLDLASLVAGVAESGCIRSAASASTPRLGRCPRLQVVVLRWRRSAAHSKTPSSFPQSAERLPGS
ncbi:hypothetical protein [Nocardioides convexus]|uniref:hypothetical protein n=1 Tax=Nocardioides convexus TaxID=2712224 RepID=UPI00241824E6|nr:hypothetical protein [Nocardioides convexus]